MSILRSLFLEGFVVPNQGGHMKERTYPEELNCASSVAQVFPRVVIATPAMLTKTATTFAMFKESCPRNAPMKRVKSPEVEDNTVVLATLVRASAAFDKYCLHSYGYQISTQVWFDQMKSYMQDIYFLRFVVFDGIMFKILKTRIAYTNLQIFNRMKSFSSRNI